MSVYVKRAPDFIHCHQLMNLEQKKPSNPHIHSGSISNNRAHVTARVLLNFFFCNWKVDDSHATITTRVMIILEKLAYNYHLLISFRLVSKTDYQISIPARRSTARRSLRPFTPRLGKYWPKTRHQSTENSARSHALFEVNYRWVTRDFSILGVPSAIGDLQGPRDALIKDTRATLA